MEVAVCGQRDVYLSGVRLNDLRQDGCSRVSGDIEIDVEEGCRASQTRMSPQRVRQEPYEFRSDLDNPPR